MEEIRRLSPCPDYDIEGRQAWLEEMARNGYVLTRFTRFGVYFKKTEPHHIRYRLQPLLRKQGPAPEEIALAEEFGWIHLGNHGYFAVFGTGDPNAQELHTDPQIQALVLGQLLRKRIMTYLTALLLYLPIIWLGFRSSLILLTENTLLLNWLVPIVLILVLWTTGAELVHLHQLQRQLTLGQPLEHAKNWQAGKYRHQTIHLSTTILCFSLILASYGNTHLPWETYRWKPVEEPLPFAALEDLAPDSRYDVGDWVMENNNEAAVRSTLLVKKQIKFLQCGYLHHPDQTVSNCWYTVDYHDMRTEYLAEALFRQLKNHPVNLSKDGKNLDLPVEQAYFYHRSRPTLLLQNGTEVLKIQFSQPLLSGTAFEAWILPEEQWIAAAAEAMAK